MSFPVARYSFLGFWHRRFSSSRCRLAMERLRRFCSSNAHLLDESATLCLHLAAKRSPSRALWRTRSRLDEDEAD
eukprot:6198229-Pleurochrysis_carterae.AAC.2